MKTRINCPYCKSLEIKYAATVIKEDNKKPKEFYCLNCHEFFLNDNKHDNINTNS